MKTVKAAFSKSDIWISIGRNSTRHPMPPSTCTQTINDRERGETRGGGKGVSAQRKGRGSRVQRRITGDGNRSTVTQEGKGI